MINFDDFCTELFQILRAYGREMVLYDEGGNRVYEPNDARRFYLTGDNILISIQEDGDNSSLKLYLSPSLNLTQVSGFIETLRVMATKANLLFHVKKFNREIKPQDFATKASVNEHQESPQMNIMEGMYGTSKSSYLKLENARMIVRHGARVNENMIGGRGRNIQSIFVENAQGERFLFPVNVLAGARAMTQHVNQGGTFADAVGSQIIRMANDFRNLAKAAQPGMSEHVAQPSALKQIRESILGAMKQSKLSFARMYESRSYAREVARVVEAASSLMEDEALAERTSAWTAILGEGFSEAEVFSLARLVEAPSQSLVEDDVEDSAEDESDDSEVDESEEVVAEDGIQTPNNPAIKEFEGWMEGFDPDNALGVQEASELDEMPSVSDLNSGMYRSGNAASGVAQVRAGNDTVNLSDGRKFRSVGPVKSPALVAGTIMMASYNSYNQGADVLEVLGYSTTKDEDTANFASLKDAAKAFGVKTLNALEDAVNAANGGGYGGGIHMVVKDLEDGKSGGWFYVSQGRFCRGSGAERLSFTKLEQVTAESVAEDEFDTDIEEATHVVGATGYKNLMTPTLDKEIDPAKFYVHYPSGNVIRSFDTPEEAQAKAAEYQREGTMVQVSTGADLIAAKAEAPVAEDDDRSGIVAPVKEDDLEMDEARVAAPDMSPTMHDVKMIINACKVRLASMSPFDPEYRTVRSDLTDAEAELAKMAPYGKSAVTVDEDEAEAEVDEARVAAPDMSPTMHDVKSIINACKVRLAAMNPFDPEYRTVRSELSAAEAELTKIAPYGKAAMSEDSAIKQNQSADLGDEIIAKDEDGNRADQSYIARLKALAGVK